MNGRRGGEAPAEAPLGASEHATDATLRLRDQLHVSMHLVSCKCGGQGTLWGWGRSPKRNQTAKWTPPPRDCFMVCKWQQM